MSLRRRLERQREQRAHAFDFNRLQTSEAGRKHGCEKCRGDERRRGLAAEMLKRGKLTTVKAVCDDCGAAWSVSLFEATPGGELRIAFAVIPKEASN